MDYVLRIEYDQDAECPMEWDGSWRLVSFNRDSIHFDHPESYLRVATDGRRVVPATIGIARKLQVGLAFVLQYYEHGLARYDIRGEGPQCHWDTTGYGGILLWEHKPSDMGARTYADRKKDATAFLAEYNNWMNGEVYGYVLLDSQGEDVSSCWGYYDPAYMSETIVARFDNGDRVMLEGGAIDAFDRRALPAGVRLVDSYDG